MSTRRQTCEDALRVLRAAPHTLDAVATRRAHDHLIDCPDCAAHLDEPDFASTAARQRRSGAVLRTILVVAALGQLVLAVPWLFGHDLITIGGHATRDHLTRDGALGVMAAFGGLVAAARARASVPMAWLCISLAAVQFLTGAVDDADNHVNLHFESTHLLLLLLAGLVALLVWRQQPPAMRRASDPRLYAVRNKTRR